MWVVLKAAKHITLWDQVKMNLDDESRCGFWWGKVEILFCFVMLRSPKPWHSFMLHSSYLSKALNESGCTNLVWDCLELQCGSYWLLNHFILWMKIKQTETENCIGIWGCWKAFSESDLIQFISQFLELRCERYWIFSGFYCWKFKQSSKIGFWRKNRLSPQCVHIPKFINF